MANKAKSQGKVRSVPASSKNCILPFSSFHSISTIFRPVTFPCSSRVNSLVNTDHILSAPSSWEEEVLSVMGHSGHGFNCVLCWGGLDNNSSCITEAAPCRLEVPIQSLPVSPPPITSTCLPFALMMFSDNSPEIT